MESPPGGAEINYLTCGAPPAGAEINFRGAGEGHICGGKM